MKPPVFERIARTLRLGRWRHFAGYDLEGNRYFEMPNVLNASSPRRMVDYRIKREWGDYKFTSIPVQWNAWLRRTRKTPPTIEELQKDLARQRKLKENVAILEQQYQEERAQLQAEAAKVGQLDAPRRQKQQEQQAPYPTQAKPSVVPTITAETGHPPSQEFGSNVPKAKPKEGVFPGMAEDSPERQQMATALDQAADNTMGKQEKERQLQGGGKVLPTEKGEPSKRYPGPVATPADDFKPQDWAPKARRRG